jgi:hypothetical protein
MKYKILVGEPWDYKSAIGENLITGKILKVISPLTIIFQSDDLLSFDGKIGYILILKPRSMKQVFTQENNYEGIVGGGLLLINDHENKDEKYLEANSKYVLVGSLERI